MVKPHSTKIKIQQKKRLFGRVILSALLLVLVLLHSVPFAEVLAHGEMDCCKGMAKMSAEACAGGFCLTKKPKRKPKLIEKICGAKELSVKQILFANLQKDSQSVFPDESSKQPNVSQLDNPAFSMSCKSDCCITSINYRNLRGFANLSKVVSISQKPRPPTRSYENNFPQLSVTVLKTVHRECKPRAPPQIFS